MNAEHYTITSIVALLAIPTSIFLLIIGLKIVACRWIENREINRKRRAIRDKRIYIERL